MRSRLQAVTARGLTRFVGRDGELEQLQQAAERARAGHGQVVAVVGDPGVGKSRLAYEVTHSPRADGWLVLETAAVSYGQAMSYWPVIDLLKSYFRLDDKDELEEIRAKVTGTLRVLDAALEAVIRGAARPAGCARAGHRGADAGAGPATPAHPRRRETAAAAGSPRAPPAPARGGPALDRRRVPGAPGQPGREPARRAPAAARHVPAGVSARLGPEELLHAAATRSAAAARCRRATARPARRSPEPGSAHAPVDRAGRGQSLLPGGGGAGVGRDASA